jgi:hypothetical protein
MHDLSPPRQETIELELPLCLICGGRGYTGCDQAHAPDGGCFIGLAFRLAVACTCPAGREFAKMQCMWIGGPQ